MVASIALGVNIDHVATLRQQRGTVYPDPVEAALIAEQFGADNITLHLREDRRHIQERDVSTLAGKLNTRMNLEMAATEAMIDFALRIRPADCCLVPERRAELTTEGGLDVLAGGRRLAEQCARLRAAGIRVALFIGTDDRQIEAAAAAGAAVVELHTGEYADASTADQTQQLRRLQRAAVHAAGCGLEVHAGHGLTYANVRPIAAILQVVELNIGHSIVSQAVFDGLPQAVRTMKQLMLAART